MSERVTFLDIEWANGRNRSICQIGMVECSMDDKTLTVLSEHRIMVNPADGFEDHCVAIHHITDSDIRTSQRFDEVWDDIHHITDTVIIGHNVVSADLDALEKNLSRYGQDLGPVRYIDTLEITKSHLHLRDYGLGTVCDHLGISIEHAHDALDDARASMDVLNVLSGQGVDPASFIHTYTPRGGFEFSCYIPPATMVRDVNELYGSINGMIHIHGDVDEAGIDYLNGWLSSHPMYLEVDGPLGESIAELGTVLKDGPDTDAMIAVEHGLSDILPGLGGGTVTVDLARLRGIVRGLVFSGRMDNDDIAGLEGWLASNVHLRGEYQYDRVMETLGSHGSDGLCDALLRCFEIPDAPSHDSVTIEGNAFCLSGNFDHGSKSDVAAYIESRGGSVCGTVTKKGTDYVVIGGKGSSGYSDGNFGTKGRTAMKYGIPVIPESDLFHS